MVQYVEPDTASLPPSYTSAEQDIAGSSSGPSTQPATGGAFGFFSNLTTPKVDLSSSFAPFNGSNGSKVRESQYSGGDTLDEPITETLKRDILQIGRRLAIVIWPMQLSSLANKQQKRLIAFAEANGVQLPSSVLGRRRSVDEEINNDEDGAMQDTAVELVKNGLDWDMWGPLVFSLAYSVALGSAASSSQTNSVFSGTFAFVWVFSLIVGINIQLLGGNISFMSAISACGYSLFPIVVGSLISAFVVKLKFVRLIYMFVLWAWSVYSGVLCLKCSGVLPGRIFLAMYPVGLMYAVLAWLCVIA